ncbi:MAG: hypothetical protein M1827_004829 [Pycnora praestabilis]|nr:MAG: hypothetical protein M1827_004829 [Pycnora praestabilis]
MTRPKVDPDKRQRTAQACDSCKRRKQKCNGLCPCNTCKKRNLSCSYGTSEHDSAEEPNFPIAKRRLTSSEDPDFEVSNPSGISPQQVTSSRLSPQSERRQALPQWDYAVEANGFGDAMKKRESLNPGVETPTIESAARSIGFFPNKNEGDVKLPLSSRGSTSSADPEEAVYNYTSSRMLQDPTGRLCQSFPLYDSEKVEVI